MHPNQGELLFFIYYFLKKKKKPAENRINQNFLTFNYYYFSGLVLIISVNSDSLVGKCQQVNDHGGNDSPQQTKTTNTLIKEGKFKVYTTLELKSTETLEKREDRVQVRNESD